MDEDWGYRMPPVWEYGNLTGYRPFDDLSGDLAKVTRYVAIDLLFTTSPLYCAFHASRSLRPDHRDHSFRTIVIGAKRRGDVSVVDQPPERRASL